MPSPHSTKTTQTTRTSTGDEIHVSIFSATSPAPPPPRTLPDTTLPPLIYHITLPHGVSAPTTPYTLLTCILSLPEPLITEVTHLGGFYLHTPHPRRTPRATRGSLTTLHTELPPTKRVYIRLHLRPKRYPQNGYAVLAEHAGVVCVYKPPELPVCAGVDNAKECLTRLSGALVTTRIDVGTSGVVLMARHQELVKEINAGLQRGEKYYVVFAEYRGDTHAMERETMEEGIWRDWYRAKPELGRGERPAILRRFDEEEASGWVEARLEIVDRRNMRFSKGKGRVFIAKLCTGRTHQIRVQMAARGYWVLDDGKYERVVGKVYEQGVIGGDARRLGLHCWLVFCGRWWRAGLERRLDLCELVDGEDGFWEWLKRVEAGLRDRAPLLQREKERGIEELVIER